MDFISYIKDRLGYILIYLISNIVTIIVMKLDNIISGNVNNDNILYTVLLFSFFLISFLLFDYSKKKKVYSLLNSIEHSDGNLQDALKTSCKSDIEHNYFIKILKDSYRNYEYKLSEYREKQKEHLYFINQWVHQMKTPVSVLNLMLQDSKDDLNKIDVNSMEEEVEKLAHGLDMALYSSRVYDFEMDFKIEKAGILSIVRNVINDHKKEFIRYSIYPKIIPVRDIIVETDFKWIRFVINQIITNSIKYTKVKENSEKNIIVDIENCRDGIKLVIKDNGVGIPKEDISRVFDPFFTGSNGRKFSESTGMGMYLSKTICSKLGHDISINSELDKWTCVSIVFHRGKSLYNMTEM